MNKDRKLVFGILALLVGIVAVSISYAAFTQNLNINGTANVQATNWSVHFANLTNAVTNGTAVEGTSPTIKSGQTSIGDYSVDFYTPGDSITYTFDVVNDGDYDAKISVLTKGTPQCSGADSTSNTNVCANLEYTLKYTSNGVDVAVDDTLKKSKTKNMTLVLRYKNTIGQNELPTAEVIVSNLGITIQYSQDSLAGGNSVTYLYYIGSSTKHIGDTLVVNNTDVFDNYSMASSSFGIPYFTAHVVNGSNKIEESYVGFVLNNKEYYLQGGDGGAAYNKNKETLISAFKKANCELENGGTINEDYNCYVLNSGDVSVVRVDGQVTAGRGIKSCYVESDSQSYCH